MKRASYKVVGHDFQYNTRAVLIEDLNGPLSVTNDAEAVVEDLLKVYEADYRIFYKDSMGQWDELLHDGKQFTGFGPGYTPANV
jgi:predicted HAD superfamily phosphohydrolase